MKWENSMGTGLIVFPILVILSFSCSEEIVINSAGDPVPVVYCLLDPMDSVQYVRVGRSFQVDGNFPDGSPDSDSITWRIPCEVYLEEYSAADVINRYPFHQDTIIRKDTGFFPTDHLRLYSTLLKPVPGNEYRLYVYFPDLHKMVSGRITMHGEPLIADPAPLSMRKINFEPGQPLTIRWIPGLNTGVYEMTFCIHYRDSSVAGTEMYFADYSNGGYYNLGLGQMMETQMGGPSFFNAMRQQIPVNSGAVRKVISVEFIMITGGVDLAFLYNLSHNGALDFRSLEDYTNLSNGLGIFSSRTETHVPNLSLSEVTLDLLAHSDSTHQLGFLDSKGK